jgi:hypothetical protein
MKKHPNSCVGLLSICKTKKKKLTSWRIPIIRVDHFFSIMAETMDPTPGRKMFWSIQSMYVCICQKAVVLCNHRWECGSYSGNKDVLIESLQACICQQTQKSYDWEICITHVHIVCHACYWRMPRLEQWTYVTCICQKSSILAKKLFYDGHIVRK